MKLLLIISLFMCSGLALAQKNRPLTIKERLRFVLWTEGLRDPLLEKRPEMKIQHLPEEIERPLQKL